MYPVNTPEVIILDRVRNDPRAQARLDRMMEFIAADRVVEVDDAGLKEVSKAWDWNTGGKRAGQYRMARSPSIILDVFRSEAGEGGSEEPPDATRPLVGNALSGRSWDYRDASETGRKWKCVCQSAWEIHCAFGCLHACDYCHVRPCYSIMLNLEELAEGIRAFGETIPSQNLYKFDNQTDTICLEPEYGASEVMVSMFADWPGRYLLLYTKSDNVEHLLNLEHKGHTLISWTVSCDTVASRLEKFTPSLEARIRAIELCQDAGYPVRVRFSPICPARDWRADTRDMVRRLLERATPDLFSIDVLGWMDISQIRGAIDLSLFDPDYVAELDRLDAEGFVRNNRKHVWPHAMRAEILRFTIEEIKRTRPEQPVSICMETTEMWDELGPLMAMEPGNYACCCGPTSVPGHELLG